MANENKPNNNVEVKPEISTPVKAKVKVSEKVSEFQAPKDVSIPNFVDLNREVKKDINGDEYKDYFCPETFDKYGIPAHKVVRVYNK